MTLDTLVMLMGVLVLVTPFLGFPVSWYKPLFFIFGAVIIGLGIIVRRGGSRIFKKRSRVRAFVESSPTLEKVVDVVREEVNNL